MIGLIRPTSGTAYVHGMDINTDMGNIYTNMGVCPQHKYVLTQVFISPKVFLHESNYLIMLIAVGLNAACFGKH